eukprot:COSAG02_NODE_11508_length_1710_cov_1.888268_1_plen_20_part_01
MAPQIKQSRRGTYSTTYLDY